MTRVQISEAELIDLENWLLFQYVDYALRKMPWGARPNIPDTEAREKIRTLIQMVRESR